VSALPEALRHVATQLSDAHLAALAAAYRQLPGCTPDAHATAQQVVPVLHHAAVARVHQAWSFEADLPGSAVALALESARLAIVRSDAPRVEIVVTGPDSPAVPIRLTSEVVAQLIDSATDRVTIVSYSVAKIDAVLDSLAEAKARQVTINLIFESPEHFAGGGGSHVYSEHLIYHWPAEQRPTPSARLHAKAVIIDWKDLLVTSANLSNLAHQSSLELGLLCRSGGIADRVQRHFDALIATGVLQAAS
jgi:cardiolipin synthase C